MGSVSVSIVIPAFNEERRLGDTLGKVTEFLRRQPWDWEVRVVDDGSSDGTVSIAEAFAAGQSGVVVQREPHRGKGGAVKAGLLAATGEYRFICDADLSMPIGEVARFLPPAARRFDVAIGSREGLRAHRIGEPVYRHLMGRLFNRGVQWLVLPGHRGLAVRLQDVHGGRRAIDLSARHRGWLGVRRGGAGGRSRAAACASSRSRSSGTIAPSRVSAWSAMAGRC